MGKLLNKLQEQLVAIFANLKSGLAKLYNFMIIMKLNLIVNSKNTYNIIMPYIYIMIGTIVYVWNTAIKPKLMETIKMIYLSLTMYLVIISTFIRNQCERIFKYGLANWSDMTWEFLWRIYPAKKFNVYAISPTYADSYKLLWVFNSGIYMLGDTYMLNLCYIKYLFRNMAMHQESSDSKYISNEITPVTFIYKINGSQHILSIDTINHTYLKDIQPSMPEAQTNWKRILFNRVQLS